MAVETAMTAMTSVRHCLCPNNVSGCPVCAARAHDQWQAFAARHPDATPGALLEQAIRQDRAEVVLGGLHEDINLPCEPTRHDSVSPLLTALRAGSLRTLALIAGQPGFDLARSLPQFETWRWVHDASPALLRAFLDIPGTRVNQSDGNGKTLLHEAVDPSTALDTLRELLRQPGLDIEAQQVDGTTALYRAGLSGKRAAFELLLGLGADPNNRNRDNLWTVLMCAVAQGREDIVDAMLSGAAGVDINAVDELQNTALQLAAKRGFVGIVERLLRHPACQVKLRNHLGWTALTQAAFAGHVEVLRRLLARPEIDVNAVDAQQQTALFHAVSAGQLEAVRLLVADPRVDASVRNQPGQHSAADMAAALGFDAMVEALAQRAKHGKPPAPG